MVQKVTFTPENLRFPYGVIEAVQDGKSVLVAATEQDFRRSEANRLNIKESEVTIAGSCFMNGFGECVGSCEQFGWKCVTRQNDGHKYCACIQP